MAAAANNMGFQLKEHEYHAEAHLLRGHLKRPVDQKIRPQGAVRLKDWNGGHFFQRAEHYSLEGLITFKSGYTHVSGARSLKSGHGWVTLSTSVLEGLNVLDVITADRLVAQVSTEHPDENGFVPGVTFLGTRFEGLKVAGHKVHFELDLNVCGPKPAGDTLYSKDPGFMSRVEKHHKKITDAGLPMLVTPEYDEEPECIDEGKSSDKTTKIACSLVTSIDPIPGVATASGNVLHIPGFGHVSLAAVDLTETVDENGYSSSRFDLTMLKMKMGCIGDGGVGAGGASSNGHHHP